MTRPIATILAVVAFATAQPALSATMPSDATIYTSGATSLSGNGTYGSVAAGSFSKSGTPTHTLADLTTAEVAAAMIDATGLSAYYLGLEQTASSIAGNVLTGGSGLNVVNITAAQLAGLSSINAVGAELLILNISGDFSKGGNWSALAGLGPDSVLFNFHDGSSVKLAGNASLAGSVLAPNALVSMSGNTGIDGSVYASSFSGSGNATVGGTRLTGLDTLGNNDPVGNDAPPNVKSNDPIVGNGPGTSVPEPGTWALLILGLGAIGVGMRRRQELPARAA